jgi:hypothetical protein
MKTEAQTDFVKAIAEIAESIPLLRRKQLYEYALFLESHPLPAEETLEAIAQDEGRWDKKFAATSDNKFAKLIASVEAEISESGTQPMFDENGDFVERT